MECLAEQLMAWLQQGSINAANIFDADTILVQSPGMAQWLKIQIAQNLGIAANLDFPLPSSFIWQLYRQHVPELPEQSAFTKPNMTWKLMSILPELLDQPEFQSIRDYLSDGQPLKLYQLCHKVADVYDQYLVYRPHWILAWEEGENSLADTDISEHPWQPILWRALSKHSEQLAESVYHRANLHQQLLQALLKQADPAQHNAKPLLVFGLSAMPQQQLEVFAALAKQREVVIFWFNPSQHYWGDVVDSKTQAKAKLQDIDSNDSQQQKASQADYLDVGNPLLSSWGKLGRDYQDMLLNLDLQQHDEFVETQANNTLEYIQNEVLNLQFRGVQEPLSALELLSNGQQYPKISISPADHSLQVHACHSKVRELEVLHDQLLSLFDQNPQWHPGDVIVMMPDVAAYAPFIEGVFGGVESALNIPFAISDRNLGDESPLLNSFIELMKLHQSRLTLSAVLAICEVPAVQARFDISLPEFELLQHWLVDAGVRWGWDETDKSRWDLPPEQQNTWLFGLTRLLAGYAMSAEQLYRGVSQSSAHAEPLTIAPYGDIEGQQAVALGKFYLFAQVLMEALTFCQEAASITDKVSISLELVEKLYLLQEQEQEQAVLTELRQAIELMLTHQHQYTETIEQDIFVSELELNLQDKGVGQRFLAGYVNFCTLMPMRSIPFKAVCLLGMNDGDYPRQVLPLGFDLMRKGAAKRGDRSRRLDDRYLFLEALLSAREVLYLSYQGFSQKDNSPRSPSILLSELLEYCQHCFCLDGQHELPVTKTEQYIGAHLLTQHALQPFAARYFEPDSGLRSYQGKWLRVAMQQGKNVQAQVFLADSLPISTEALISEQNPDNNELNLDELINFFINPAKAFFIQRWQCRFSNFSMVNQDDEPFAFDALDKYKLNDRLIAGDRQSNWQERLGAEGKLPLANSGAIYLRQIEKQSEIIIKQLDLLCNERDASKQEVNLAINGVKLVAWIDQCYGQNLIMWRAGKLRAKDKLSLYLNWLCLCAKPPNVGLGEAHFVGTDKPFSLAVIEADEALQQLEVFVGVWRLGQTQAVYFYPETAWQWVKTHDPDKTLQTFIGNAFVDGEGNEPHIQRLCPDLSVHFEEFCQLSEQLMAPLFNYGGGK
ncbi:MAG: exodeoxyribonuclease V gamma subunit [Paraglaciecola sp.]|jgi:exodeoxyribonuclease V gamma subunit